MVPVPFFSRLNIPEQLRCIDVDVSAQELDEAMAVRSRFFLEDGPGAYMVDIVRAFRPVMGASVYIEVGTRDKGNIAWLQRHLNPNALIIDVDLEQIGESKQRLVNYLLPTVSYLTIEGDSVNINTVKKVESALNGRNADAIFLDSSHMYNHILREFDLYFNLLRPGGILLIHDVFWEGNDTEKGKAQALEFIDRYFPVYAVYMNEPIRRFFPLANKDDVWGGVGIIIKPAESQS